MQARARSNQRDCQKPPLSDALSRSAPTIRDLAPKNPHPLLSDTNRARCNCRKLEPVSAFHGLVAADLTPKLRTEVSVKEHN